MSEPLRRHSDSSEEGDEVKRNLMDFALERPREAKFCLAFLAIIGTIVFITGAIFLVTAPFNERDENVGKYNEAVKAWKAQYRSEFEGLDFQLNYTSSLNLTYIRLLPDTDNDIIKDDKTSELEGYDALKYRMKIEQTFPSSGPEWIKGQSGGTDWQDLFHPGETSPFISFPRLWVKRTTVDPIKCHSKGGTYDESEEHCRYHYQADAVCVQLEQDGVSKVWHVSNTAPGPGCHFRDVIPIDFSPPTFKFIKSGGEGKEPGSYLKIPIEFTLRSAHDPWIVLNKLSEGTLSFGSNSGEAVGTGVFLALAGAVMLIPTLWFAWVFKKRHGFETAHHLAEDQNSVIYVSTPSKKGSRAAPASPYTGLALDDGVGGIDERFVYTPPVTSAPPGERDVI